MADKSGLKEKSLLPLYIFEILRKFSSKESPMSEKKIKDTINEAKIFKNSVRDCDGKFRSIKKKDRKIIPRHIRTLVEHFPGLIVPVETGKNKAAKWYYDSSKAEQFPFISRNNFSIDEIGFLVDMVSSSKLLTEQSSDAFIKKLFNSLNIIDKEVAEKRYKSVTKSTRVVKNENQYVHEIFDKLQCAIKDKKRVNITINTEEIELKEIKNVNVYAIYRCHAKEQIYVYAQDGDRDVKIELAQIKHVDLLSKSSNYNESIIKKLKNEGFVIIDKYDKSKNLEISNDTLFVNLRFISSAISKKRLLSFKDFNLWAQNEAITRTILPIKIILQDDFYYLVAIEIADEGKKPVYIKVTLMEDLRLGKSFNEKDFEKEKAKLSINPLIYSQTTNITVKFYIKREAMQYLGNEFGEPERSKSTDPFDNMGINMQKIGRKFSEELTKALTGYEHKDELIEITVETTEEEAFRWALKNADVVELKSPKRLRIKLLELTKYLVTRYSKSPDDKKQEHYRRVISGEEFLTYGTLSIEANNSKKEDWIFKRISDEKAYSKIKKLKIRNTPSPISNEELEKYTNIEELVVEGNGVNDFSWIGNLSSLKSLALSNTTMVNGDVLTKISPLKNLFLSKNHFLESYDFLINMKIDALFVGKNEKANTSTLWDLKNVNDLILEENLLCDIDFECLLNPEKYIEDIQKQMSIWRWIEEPLVFKWPVKLPINYHLLLKMNRN